MHGVHGRLAFLPSNVKSLSQITMPSYTKCRDLDVATTKWRSYLDWGVATTISEEATSWQPAAAATPVTTLITGTGNYKREKYKWIKLNFKNLSNIAELPTASSYLNHWFKVKY